MHTQAPPQTPQPSLGRRLARVFRPGRIESRVEAAASLPLWAAGPMVVLSICLLAEAIPNNIEILDSVDNRLEAWKKGMQLWILPEVFSNWGSFLVGLFMLGLVLLGLEVVNLLVLAPFAVPMGERLRSRMGACRKVVYSLGGLWAVQAAAFWMLICLFVVPPLYWSLVRPAFEHGSFISTDVIFLGFAFYIVLPLALLLGLAMRLMRACNHLAGAGGESPAQLCGGCGYLLEGLAAGAGCPECGLADPAGVDRAREATAWSQLRGPRRSGALVRTATAVALRPRRFFRGMKVWGQAHQGRGFLCWTIWASMPLSVLSLPGVLAAWRPGAPNEEDWYMIPVVMAAFSVLSALVVLLVLGLLICLVGFGVSRARQGPAWPLAAAAGSYLAGLVPWIAAAQALWLWPFFAINGGLSSSEWTIWDACENVARCLPIDPQILFAAMLLLPALVGSLVAIRTAVVCYRGVRYACR